MWRGEQMKKGAFILNIIIIFSAIFAYSRCKSPARPELYSYRNNVEVIYTRDISKITNLAGKNSYVSFDYLLYDPERSQTLDQGSIFTEQISENAFRAYLPRVFVQTEKRSEQHKAWIADPKLKLFDAIGNEISTSSFTGENIVISGAYDLQVFPLNSGTRLHFRMQ
jgi:hypothetical protein